VAGRRSEYLRLASFISWSATPAKMTKLISGGKKIQRGHDTRRFMLTESIRVGVGIVFPELRRGGRWRYVAMYIVG